MDSDQELAYDYSPRFRVYKNGQIQRLATETFVPPSLLTPQNGVVSKDAVYSPEKTSLRIYLPHQALESGDENINKKLPLLIYFHGGAFIMETPSLLLTMLSSHQPFQPPAASPSRWITAVPPSIPSPSRTKILGTRSNGCSLISPVLVRTIG